MIQQICICGSGTMGLGIAQVSAAAGFHTIVYDVNRDVLEKALQKLTQTLQQLVAKGKITAEKQDDILDHLVFISDVEQCRGGLVIEAVVEKMEVKTSLFQKLEAINDEQTIFASNTSSLSITAIAEKLNDPSRFAGLHFFNPAPLMKLVEVVKGRETSPQTIKQLSAVVKQMGKQGVVCTDSPGFIVNRVARPFYIESLRLLEEGIAGVETIDSILESTGFRMGPFRLMDLIGNDVNYAVSCSVYEQLQQPERLRPSYIQQQKVEKNELGKKTGRGYYDY